MTDPGETERRLRARIGGLSLHIYGDSEKIAERARAGLDARFYREAVEIDPTLEGQSLEKMVDSLRSLYFTRLALKSVKTIKKKHRQADGA